MALNCINLTTGRDLPCKSPGGVLAFYLFNGGDETVFTTGVDNVVTDIQDDAGGSATAYLYKIKSATELKQTLTSSAENRTAGEIAQAFTAILHQLDYKTENELKLMSYGSPYVVVHLNNGNAVVMGLMFGCNLDTAEAASGSGITEFNGYTLTITAKEMSFASYLKGATLDNPFAGLTTAPTIETNTAPAQSVP